ncbi:MAG TPA: sigma-54 dependent transcriptional regulator [Thermoanaerobaculia bacterium]|nr:sigma-54 dependent transcriptional regulator [Thermoanaerobaculia bacterium]
MKGARLLLVDDEEAIRFAIADFLDAEGYRVACAGSLREARGAIRKEVPELLLLDYQLPDGNSLDLVEELRGTLPDLPIVMMTGHGSIDLAVRAIKLGAEQFLTKPVELPALEMLVRKVVETQRQRRKLATVRPARVPFDPFCGESDAIRRVREDAERLAGADRPLLIRGETGTGKGVLARWLHGRGPRADETFVDLNCAGLSRELLDSELFGHERGAFTGAVARKRGLLEIADHGTLFLDEIGEMDTPIQPKLLKALEERRFRRLGDVRDLTSDFALIVATHRDLREMIRAGAFREDLYFRISTLTIVLPPLRDRAADIPLLAERMLFGFAAERGKEPIELTPAAAKVLVRYSWPGNIRELKNVLERAFLLCDGRTIRIDDLRFDLPAHEPDPRTLEQAERAHILHALEAAGGSVEVAAARLEIPRSTLYFKIKRHSIPLSRI